MLKKNEIKDIQSLSHKKFRNELGCFLAEGPKITSELLQIIPAQCQKIYGLESWIAANKALLNDVSYESISESELTKISQLQTSNEVVGVWKQFESREPDGNSFTLYLDTIQDPGNFGTIIRIADWFDIGNIVCSEGCADVYNPKVVQSTMASIARVNMYYDTAFTWINKQKSTVYAAVLGGQPIFGISKTETGILIIGNESKGIQPLLLERAIQKITIPRRGEAESLNAAVATGIILSHLL